MVATIKHTTARNLKLIFKDLDAHGKVVKIGWFQETSYPSQGKKPALPVAMAAAINEYGVPAKNIPPRPFIRSTVSEKQQEWFRIATEGARRIVAGKSNINEVLDDLGGEVQGDIFKKISTLTEPPLSPRTIAARLARKSDKKTVGLLTKPLIDTGLMLSSLSYRVEDE